MRRKLALLLILVSFLTLPLASFAYISDICDGNVCTEKEVGRFMQNISKGCGNSGDCSLGDIMIVFSNVALFILGIVGSLVLLMYVIGGFYLLTSHGNSSMVTKGKSYITISTTGLIIVLFAYIIIEFLLRSLTLGTVSLENESCLGKNEGTSCGTNAVCLAEVCTQIQPKTE
ncbi:hypothetical protein HY771_00540 [Candidatus Uhrbacteria bacterium]|nr:hypothetical protein [Candidatus Uhrbacteria bacterium]